MYIYILNNVSVKVAFCFSIDRENRYRKIENFIEDT